MNPGIFLIQDNEELVEMNEQSYDSEKLLQSWLAKYPALLVGGQIDAKEPRRWLFIEQECAVPSEEGGAGRWAIDHLFMDQDAIPTIVEVKRSTDTRIRREVVGQMLDYAANAVVHWPVAHMRERFNANCESCGLDPEEKLREFLEEDVEPEEFWQMADRNLREHKIRLLFVADLIPTELQRIVEFLNDQMDQTEVLAIEIKQFVGEGGLRSLIPRVIGQTAKAQDKKPQQRGERNPLRKRFWEGLLALAKSKTELHADISPTDYHWIGAGAGLSGLGYNYVVRKHGFTVELYMGRKDSGTNKKMFDDLLSHKLEIEQAFQGSLSWERADANLGSKIAYYLETGGYEDAEDLWPTIHESMVDAMIRLEKATAPYLDNLRNLI